MCACVTCEGKMKGIDDYIYANENLQNSLRLIKLFKHHVQQQNKPKIRCWIDTTALKSPFTNSTPECKPKKAKPLLFRKCGESREVERKYTHQQRFHGKLISSSFCAFKVLPFSPLLSECFVSYSSMFDISRK